jgi:hypothetical protein
MSSGIFQDLTRQKFGRLTVIKRGENGSRGQVRWFCQCDCGNHNTIYAQNLISSHTVSCGCHRKEVSAKINFKHGATIGEKTANIKLPRSYIVWERMRSRCRNINDKSYNNYGGRGINICERWNHYENFLNDMGEPPTKAHSLDRIDNNRGYSLENCRWATQTEQARNKRSNRLITYNGETHCLNEWAEILGMDRCVITARLSRGWSINEALTRPNQKSRKRTAVNNSNSNRGEVAS